MSSRLVTALLFVLTPRPTAVGSCSYVYLQRSALSFPSRSLARREGESVSVRVYPLPKFAARSAQHIPLFRRRGDRQDYQLFLSFSLPGEPFCTWSITPSPEARTLLCVAARARCAQLYLSWNAAGAYAARQSQASLSTLATKQRSAAEHRGTRSFTAHCGCGTYSGAARACLAADGLLHLKTTKNRPAPDLARATGWL